jgi:hypothetical protein
MEAALVRGVHHLISYPSGVCHDSFSFLEILHNMSMGPFRKVSPYYELSTTKDFAG